MSWRKVEPWIESQVKSCRRELVRVRTGSFSYFAHAIFFLFLLLTFFSFFLPSPTSLVQQVFGEEKETYKVGSVVWHCLNNQQ